MMYRLRKHEEFYRDPLDHFTLARTSVPWGCLSPRRCPWWLCHLRPWSMSRGIDARARRKRESGLEPAMWVNDPMVMCCQAWTLPKSHLVIACGTLWITQVQWTLKHKGIWLATMCNDNNWKTWWLNRPISLQQWQQFVTFQFLCCFPAPLGAQL